MDFDLGFWIGIISLVLAVPLGVAANLLTPKLIASFERRKILTEGRNREQELRAYQNIKEMRDGVRDKYAHYITISTTSVFFAVASSTLVIIGFPRSTEGEVLALALALILALFALVFLIIIPLTENKI